MVTTVSAENRLLLQFSITVAPITELLEHVRGVKVLQKIRMDLLCANIFMGASLSQIITF